MIAIIDKPTHTQRVVDALEADIRSGGLRSGMKLLPRRKLCERFEVSAAIIDSAYRILEQKGLVVRHRGSGVMVSPKVLTSGSMLVGVVSSMSRGDIEDYFEPLLGVAADSRVVPAIVHCTQNKDWRRTLLDLMARKPDALIVDVEARNLPLEELHDIFGPTPVCYANRWEWRPDRPERAVLVDYQAAWFEGIKKLWLRGNDRMLQVIQHRKPQPYLAEYLDGTEAELGQADIRPQIMRVSVEEFLDSPEPVRQRIAAFKPMAVIGQSDFALIQLESLCPETAAMDRIGFF
ncbi:MAG: winged helix-turn-helix domain-containing protein, partial [Kiritimatiellae bacterium]|nr:winged helix-turn-helix domain-containing protein [Kiritimatiellia bacterium]